jgi:hypothetical protein
MSLNHTSQYAQLTDGQFASIGRIVVEWANIEFLCKQVLAHLMLCPSFPSRTFTDRMNAFSVQDAIVEGIELHRIRYAARIIAEPILGEIEQLNRQIHDARGNRNRFAHFCWSRSTDEEIFGTNFSAGHPDSKKHRKSYSTMTTKDLDDLYQASHLLVESLEAVIARLPQVTEDDVIQMIREQNKPAHPTAGDVSI